MLADVAGIGLSGQMLGVTLLDERDRPLRPAILWNDGRANQECEELERLVPDFAEIVGCRAMAGFPAPKLRWLRRHEPERLDQARLAELLDPIWAASMRRPTWLATSGVRWFP